MCHWHIDLLVMTDEVILTNALKMMIVQFGAWDTLVQRSDTKHSKYSRLYYISFDIDVGPIVISWPKQLREHKFNSFF